MKFLIVVSILICICIVVSFDLIHQELVRDNKILHSLAFKVYNLEHKDHPEVSWPFMTNPKTGEWTYLDQK